MAGPEEVQNQTIRTTVTVVASDLEPSIGLFQPSFPLTEANFLRMKQTSPVLTSAAGAIIAFGLSYFLPVLIRTLRAPSKDRTWPVDDLMVSGVCLVIGGLLLVFAYFASKGRRRVLRAIEGHFESHPGQHEVRTSR